MRHDNRYRLGDGSVLVVEVTGVGSMTREINKLLVVAGAGDYPRLIVEGAKKNGVGRVDIIAIKGSTARATVKAADNVHAITLGEITSSIRWAAAERYDGVVLAGQINPLSLFRARFDEEVKAALKALPVKNAHSVFGRLIEMFNAAGLEVLPSSLYMDDNIPGVGPMTRRGFSEREESDIRHAIKVVSDIGRHDVGQTVMVKEGMVLAVEAFEGTNAAIRRGARLAGNGAVLFKAARDGHDMRFDIPVIGLKTLKIMKKSGVTALGFQAFRQIVLDRDEVVKFADKNNIAIVGVDSGLPGAPLRLV